MTSNSVDPYQKHRNEYQMQNDNLNAAKQNWQRIAFLLAIVAIGELALVMYSEKKAHVIPFVVEVDTLGRAQAMTELKDVPINDERIIRAFIFHYLDRARTIASDPEIIKQYLGEVYKDSIESVQRNFLDPYYLANNPLDFMQKKGTRYIEPKVFLKQDENTYSVEWVEYERNYDNQLLSETRYKGLISIVQVPPTNSDSFKDNPDNPFGFYVTSVSWTKLI
jgi:type IV secretion system protein TrbF